MTATASDSLAAAITAAQHELAALEALLGEERAALRERDGARLEAIAAQKQTHFQALDALALPARLPAGDGVEARLAARHGADVAGRWRDLVSSLRSVQRENEVNGLTIQRTLSAVAAEIALLHGQTGPGERIYAQNGRRPETGGGGSLLSRA